MAIDPRCAEIRLLLPEFALGTLTGEERAGVLEHLGGCAECRRELQSLVEVGDELLVLAPMAEPPVGFESRVMERLASDAPSRRRARRLALFAAALLVAASLAGGGVYLFGGSDRELADSYRDTLGVADGRYVAARPLLGNDGRDVGYVFGYQGSPSWIFCVVRAGDDGTYDIEVTTASDRWVSGDIDVRDGAGTWHQVLDADLHDLSRIRLVERATREEFVAEW